MAARDENAKTAPGLRLPNICSVSYVRPMALPVVGPGVPDPDRSDVPRLRAEWSRYRRRYGAPPAPPLERLESRVQGHRVRLERIEEQIAELEAERRRLTQELSAWEKAIALTLGTEIERLRVRYGETWSPTPVPGYRAWQMVGGFLRGARLVWRHPSLRAVCAHGGDPDEVPHSDGRCGRLGCGIYAAKQPDLLVRELTLDWEGALAVVGLRGKVVEHAAGYRAREAQVLALGMVGSGRWLTTDDPARIAAAFDDPVATLLTQGERLPITPWRRIVEFLTGYESRMREGGPWTSVSNNG